MSPPKYCDKHKICREAGYGTPKKMREPGTGLRRLLLVIHQVIVRIGLWLERKDREALQLALEIILKNRPAPKVQRQPIICKECNNWHPTLSYPFCNKCGRVLTEGPTGGMSINMVCDICRINFGCLGD